MSLGSLLSKDAQYWSGAGKGREVCKRIGRVFGREIVYCEGENRRSASPFEPECISQELAGRSTSVKPARG